MRHAIHLDFTRNFITLADFRPIFLFAHFGTPLFVFSMKFQNRFRRCTRNDADLRVLGSADAGASEEPTPGGFAPIRAIDARREAAYALSARPLASIRDMSSAENLRVKVPSGNRRSKKLRSPE